MTEPTPTDASAPVTTPAATKPIITRAAEATVAAASTAATVAIGLLPSLNTCLSLVVGGLMTWGGLAVKAHYEMPKLVIRAADPPKLEAQPMRVVIEPLDAIKGELAALRAQATVIDVKIDKLVAEIKPAPATKRTKTAVTR